MDKAEKTAYFEDIITNNEKSIRRVIFFYCSNKQDIWSDLYQEILTNIWESLDTFKGNSHINTWVYRIAINISILYSKKNNDRKNIMYFSSFADAEKYLPPQEDDVIEKLYTLIEQLNTVDKTIMLLYLDKCSHKEIAEIMGFSLTNVGTKISRIIKKLKEINAKTEHDEY
ncbi:MAG TPA: sigma-70 family RNA polymerase sigma factor [Bacteroidales bacterium]|nr:sigma-70 family RNA polymerase sigma factor [Bacteroidales bacterium]HOR82158.1 sigma-70 family RNA polymerase sigma factor [Bacteroidales bacterium]HPJ91441.1 sigma-70 family RNA polymerase sigma factor [Bacteroidales bacterium]